MGGGITRLVTRAERMHRDEALQMRQMLLRLEPELATPRQRQALTELVAHVDARTRPTKRKPFVMLTPEQCDDVADWLSAHSKRPALALRVWIKLFRHMRDDTGELVFSRVELAQELGCPPNNLSGIMAEMVECKALLREREGNTVRFFMNPNVCTKNLGGKAREIFVDHAPALNLRPPVKKPKLRVVETVV
jgi:hypothetical protein